MGRDCLKVLKSINLSSTESQDSKACLQALENYFKPAKPPLSFIREIKVLIIYLTMPTRLRHLSQSCNFGVAVDSILRDCLILGTKDKKAQAHLFREKTVDLNIAINCSRNSELAEQQLKKVNSTICENVSFNKRKDKQRDRKR